MLNETLGQKPKGFNEMSTMNDNRIEGRTHRQWETYVQENAPEDTSLERPSPRKSRVAQQPCALKAAETNR